MCNDAKIVDRDERERQHQQAPDCSEESYAVHQKRQIDRLSCSKNNLQSGLGRFMTVLYMPGQVQEYVGWCRYVPAAEFVTVSCFTAINCVSFLF